MIKKVILAITILVVSFLFWFFVNPWIQNPVKVSDWEIWLMPLVLMIVLNCLLVIGFSLFEKWWQKIGLTFLVGSSFFIVFGVSELFLAAVVIAILLQMYASRGIKLEAGERAQVNFGHMIQHGSPRIVTSFFILISFAYFLTPGVQTSDNFKRINSKVEGLVQQVADSFLGDQINNLPPQERQKVENQVISQASNQIFKNIEPFANYIPPLLAFGMFLILQTFSFIIIWLSVVFGILLFWIMKKSGFIRIEKVQIEAEKVVF